MGRAIDSLRLATFGERVETTSACLASPSEGLALPSEWCAGGKPVGHVEWSDLRRRKSDRTSKRFDSRRGEFLTPSRNRDRQDERRPRRGRKLFQPFHAHRSPLVKTDRVSG